MRQIGACKAPHKTSGKYKQDKKQKRTGRIFKQGPRLNPRWLGRNQESDRLPYTARYWNSTLHSVENFPSCKSGNLAAVHCGMTKVCVVCRAKADLPFMAEGWKEKGNALVEKIRLLRNENKEWNADCGVHPEKFFQQMVKIMAADENAELRANLARYGAVPMTEGSLRSKIQFGKLTSTSFIHMTLSVPEIKVKVRAFENLGQQRYAQWFRNAGHGKDNGRTTTKQVAEIVQAALALQVLASLRPAAAMAFLGNTRDFADWLSLDFIFD